VGIPFFHFLHAFILVDIQMFGLSQASNLTVLLFALYPQPCGASDKEQKKALVECPINVHETP